eukprot:m.213775 g.213775  ORF g.213775 m.213775 type:complete len:754 (-) comp29388_c0_seq1:172-2433(-)
MSGSKNGSDQPFTLQEELYEMSQERRQAAARRIHGGDDLDGSTQTEDIFIDDDDLMSIDDRNGSSGSGSGGGGSGSAGGRSAGAGSSEAIIGIGGPDGDEGLKYQRENPFTVTWRNISFFLRGLPKHRRAIIMLVVASTLLMLLGVLVFAPLSRKAWLTLGVLLMVFTILATETLGICVVFCLASTVLMLFEVLTPANALAGFSDTSVGTVGVLYVVAEGIQRTSALTPILRVIMRRPRNLIDAYIRLCFPTLIISAFLNNTPVVAMMIPVVRRFSQTSGISPSLLYMPMNVAAILGGTITIIGTSANLVVTGLMGKDNLKYPHTTQVININTFDISKAGLCYGVPAMLLAIVLARYLLPRSRSDAISTVLDDPKQYTVAVKVVKGSNIDGDTVADAGLRHLRGLFLAEVTREDGTLVVAPSPDTRLNGGDTLLFVGVVESVTELYHISGLQPATKETAKIKVARHRRQLVEVVIAPSSAMVGRTVRDCRFRHTFNAVIIAVCRQGEVVRSKIGDIVLRGGDLLLVETSLDRGISLLAKNPHFTLVSPVNNSTPVQEHAMYQVLALGIMIGMLLWSQFKPLNLFICASVSAFIMIVTGCLTLQQAIQAVNLNVIFAIGSSFGLATALDITGAAREVANAILSATDWAGDFGVIFGVFLTTSILTQFITNNAAAALVYPIVKSIIATSGIKPEAVLFALMFGASSSVMTPIGYQTNLMVHSLGGYTFVDWIKVGAPLTFYLCFAASFFCWIFYS